MFCRRCGAALHQGVVICPECGARQRRGISSVRCARCGGRVSLGLTVCPHCGRDVHPAGPRWGLWLVGFAVIAFAALWGLDELPVEKINTQVASVRTRVARIVQVFGPAAAPSREATAQGTATPRMTQVVAALPVTSTPPATQVVLTKPAVSPTAEAPTQAPTETPAVAETPVVSATPTTEPTATETATSAPTSTPEPPVTPTVAPTEAPPATPAPAGRVVYKVKSGDTLSSIAAQYGLTWQEVASANGLTGRSTLRAGQELVIPVQGQAQSTAVPAAAPAEPIKYKVQSGDNLSTIAAKYGITWQELAAANGLSGSSRLRVGQELIIPGQASAAQASPTAAPTSAPATPAATPTAAALVLLPAPQLVSPGDQAPFAGSGAIIELAWARVDGLPSDAGYRVSLHWIEEGAPMEYLVPITTATSIRMPPWLFGRADQPARQYSWSVRVVREGTDGRGGEKDVLLSPASVTRVFYWN